jgi:hypothetical protein
MKQTIKRIIQTLSLLLFLIILIGLSINNSNRAVSPFSKATWNYSKADLLELEGSSFEVYDSVYGGDCYTYPKSFEGYKGTIKYMFNQDDHLMCIAWACALDEEDELHSLYDTIQKSVIDQYGDSSYQTEKDTNYGNVWYRREGNIIISTMVTSDLKVLQYAFLHPDVSSPEQKK